MCLDAEQYIIGHSDCPDHYNVPQDDILRVVAQELDTACKSMPDCMPIVEEPPEDEEEVETEAACIKRLAENIKSWREAEEAARRTKFLHLQQLEDERR